ncbi:MAG: PilN domain-containing protein [Opitutus sp.]
MLSLRKKSSDAEEPLPAWHPDFRNFQRLPDTKVIRTSFLIGGAATLIALLLLTWVSYRAYFLRDLHAQLNLVQGQIDRDKSPSDQAIAQYKKFQAESARVNEVSTFLKSRPVVSDLLLNLGKTLPDYVAIDRFDLNATTLNLRGTVRGAPDQASGRASTYLQLLKSDPYFTDKFSEITLLNLNRGTQNNGLVLELSFKLKEAKKP